MSLPCHQPEKWNGMKAWSGPTPSVNFAVTLIRPPVGVLTPTCSPLRILRPASCARSSPGRTAAAPNAASLLKNPRRGEQQPQGRTGALLFFEAAIVHLLL